jgi:hypothetical protein
MFLWTRPFGETQRWTPICDRSIIGDFETRRAADRLF